MYVIGTAGHVDHGKSTLVEKLTGIDPDRLREEKERGMTIDLGFAWLPLPDGNEVSIIDVPGHERFVNNMLAGVGGIDLALLVVAADESVMPQTREHLAILDLLQVKRGLVAVTKSDLVEEDWLDLVSAEVEDLIEGTTLEGSPVMAVSGATGEGLPELITAIQQRLDEGEPRKDLGRPRLPIDRAFTISGFGTVVTGTLMDGVLEVGQEVALEPTGRKSRVRGLQSHKNKLDRALPGTRVAANLAGIAHEDVARGEVLTTSGWLESSTAIDVQLKVLVDAPRPVRHNMFATVHVGSSETVARVRLLERDLAYPGDTTWAQLKLERPGAIVKGDFFVIRSNNATLGGGHVVEPHARRHRRNHRPILDRLEVMSQGTDRDIIIKSIEASEPSVFDDLVNRANLEKAVLQVELEGLAAEGLAVILGDGPVGPGTMVFTAAGWSGLAIKSGDFVDGYHRQYPLRTGAPKEELRSRLGMKQQAFGHVLAKLQADGVLVEDGPSVRRADHVKSLSDEQRLVADRYVDTLRANPYSPPTDSPPDAELLGLLDDEGRVVRVNDSVVFEAGAYGEMVDGVKAYIAGHGEITVADVRDMFGASRKYALGLLDHLDQQRVTRRVGDARVLR
jgi:selenocysteine-specific elongation factor